MTLIGVLAGSAVLTFVSAYMLNKMSDRAEKRRSEGLEKGINAGLNDALQIIFFFLLISGLLMMGRAGYYSMENCQYLVNETTITNVTTTYGYSYTCNSDIDSSFIWLYRLPIYLGILAATSLVLYYFKLLIKFVREIKGGRGREE